jgi:cobalamin biosynthesis protein CobC
MRITMGAADHGGGIDAAAAQFGGAREDWIDLSTGINRLPYPVGNLPPGAWQDLPDARATADLVQAARDLWRIPAACAVLPAPGASSLIARIPLLMSPGPVSIPGPTYNEHARAFHSAGWTVLDQIADARTAGARVIVHPNNPDGRLWTEADCDHALMIIDESFGDVDPDQSLIRQAATPGTLVLKSLGKFWGLAGARLGFAIGDPDLIARLATMLGPWPVSGPALVIGRDALRDTDWAARTRHRLTRDTGRLDGMMKQSGADIVGGTTLFRLYDVDDAAQWQDRLARHHIWTRRFPYSARWLRLGLPGSPAEWDRLASALSKARAE